MTDSRGYFAEVYSPEAFDEMGLQTKWVQENQSLTASIGTIRGLHFQAPPHAQAKLIRVPRGRILDVFVDIRKNSTTFGQWDSIELSGSACNAVYVPHGFAHGFCTLAADTIVQYKVDNSYSKDREGGIRWDDPILGIDWSVVEPVLSEKDQVLPFWQEFTTPFA